MDAAERLRFVLIVVGAMLVLFCLALSLAVLDKTIYKSGAADLNEVRRPFEIGEKRTFNVFDYSLQKRVDLELSCAVIGDHSIVYKEDIVRIPQATLERIATEFDDNIYPVNRGQLLGKPIMGITNDDKTIILLLNDKRGRPADIRQRVVSGYYSQENEQLKIYKSESNQARIIHVFVGRFVNNDDSIIETIAHETRHLRNWSVTKNNVGLIIGSLFAFATVMTLYLGLSNLYLRSFPR